MTHGIRPEIAHLARPITELAPDPDNPNDGDVDAIAASLQLHGQYRPHVAWMRPDGPDLMLAGNTTYAAALSLGWTHLAVTPLVADSREEAVRIMLGDNRYARLGRMNTAQEVALLQALPDLAGTGYVDTDLADLQAQLDRMAVTPIWADDDDRRPGAGLREALLVLPADDHAELLRLFDALRRVMGEQPQGVVALRAARMAVAVLDGCSGHKAGCSCPWCGVARQAGESSVQGVARRP